VIHVVLAHGSGVDDVLWFLVPVVLALVVLRRAERRAARQNAESDPVESQPQAPPER
jgi:hypothetical protein